MPDYSLFLCNYLLIGPASTKVAHAQVGSYYAGTVTVTGSSTNATTNNSGSAEHISFSSEAPFTGSATVQMTWVYHTPDPNDVPPATHGFSVGFQGTSSCAGIASSAEIECDWYNPYYCSSVYGDQIWDIDEETTVTANRLSTTPINVGGDYQWTFSANINFYGSVSGTPFPGYDNLPCAISGNYEYYDVVGGDMWDGGGGPNG